MSTSKSEQTFPMADVIMPSGKVVSITIPSRRCCCKSYSETKYVRLWRNGKMGRFENQFVWDEMQGSIQKHDVSIGGDYDSYDILKIQKLINCCSYTKFRNRMIDMEKEGVDVTQRMLFHGSAAVDKIVKRGFDERYSKLDGLFGAGIYFAKHSSKSNQYVYGFMGGTGCDAHNDKSCYECERKMLLCRVLLGRMFEETNAKRRPHAPVDFDSVVGVPSPGKLKYPEYIVYKGEQGYPEYLITYKLLKKKRSRFEALFKNFGLIKDINTICLGKYEGYLRKDGIFVFNYK